MPDDHRADQSLTERARSGDEAAWRTIYESTCDRLFALLCYQIGDRDEARDVLQETYLQAFRRLDTYRGEAPIEAWLRAIALARATDWKRVILRRLQRTVRIDESALRADVELPETLFESERDALRRALAGLPPRQRAVLLLREWEERSFREIAEMLGCRESTARVHHARAREHMRAALRGDEFRPLSERRWEGHKP